MDGGHEENKLDIKVFEIIVYIIYIAIFSICLANALFPKWCWKVFESWKASKEPTKAYFLRRRLEGIAGMIIIAALALTPKLIA